MEYYSFIANTYYSSLILKKLMFRSYETADKVLVGNILYYSIV